MSWLMVAKIPLLISSRMMSAGLVPRRSASSLTVIVAGSSIAPRSLGSTTCTAPGVNAPVRRGGLRGPRRPRVPLLLRAMGPSFVVVDVRGAGGGALRRFCGDCRDGRVGGEAREERVGDGRLQRVVQGPLPRRNLPAGGVAAQVRAASRATACRIQGDRTVCCAHDAHQVPLRTSGAAGDAAALRGPPRTARRRACRGGPARAGAPAYDDTSSEVVALRLRFAGAAATASSSFSGSPAGAVPLDSAAGAAFFEARGFFAAGTSASGAAAAVSSAGVAGTSVAAATGVASSGAEVPSGVDVPAGADASSGGEASSGAVAAAGASGVGGGGAAAASAAATSL